MRYAIILCAVLLSFSACKGAGPDAETESSEPTSYQGVGVIKGVKSEGRVLIIDHENIEGFMEAMMMPFALDDPKLASGLKAGDKVEFTLTEKGGDWPITKIKKVQK